MKINKRILIVSLILMSFMMIAAEPLPPDAPENAFDMLAPVGEWAAKIFSVVFGAAIFLFGTIQGTQLVKILFPKLEDKERWMKVRRQIIRGVSIVVAIFGVVGANLDFFGAFETMDALFGVDPIFGQLFSGLALSLGSNWVYSNYVDEG